MVVEVRRELIGSGAACGFPVTNGFASSGQQAAGEWSDTLYTLYTLNPLACIIEAFQSVVLRSQPPDLNAMIPGAIMIAILLPLSYLYFKRAESYFADVI